jgi:hypothetical protein
MESLFVVVFVVNQGEVGVASGGDDAGHDRGKCDSSHTCIKYQSEVSHRVWMAQDMSEER